MTTTPTATGEETERGSAHRTSALSSTSTDGADHETRKQAKRRPGLGFVEAVSLTGISVALLYILQRGFRISNVEFLFLAAYLVLILAFLVSAGIPADRRPSFETFFADAATKDAHSKSLSVLYEMPGKVVAKIGPGIDRIASSFRGDGYDSNGNKLGSGGGGGSGPDKLVRMSKGNVYLTAQEKKEDDASASQTKSLTTQAKRPHLENVIHRHNELDHMLCRLKHADEQVYKQVMSLDWLNNRTSNSANTSGGG